MFKVYTQPQNFQKNWYIIEGLVQQLENKVCTPVPFKGKMPFLIFENGTLAFLTSLSPGGNRLVVYGSWSEEEKFFYWETPYTGWRIPENLDEFLDKNKERFWRLPPFKFHLYEVKDTGEEESQIISSGKRLYKLQIDFPNHDHRAIYFLSCP